MKTRVGEINLNIPQVRDATEPFYPQSIERGQRSERALKLALAELYIQGVSTRKVKAITEKLCGFEVSSAQVSRITTLLDKELEAWRTRPIGGRVDWGRFGPSPPQIRTCGFYRIRLLGRWICYTLRIEWIVVIRGRG